jgi:hypothetical protein
MSFAVRLVAALPYKIVCSDFLSDSVATGSSLSLTSAMTCCFSRHGAFFRHIPTIHGKEKPGLQAYSSSLEPPLVADSSLTATRRPVCDAQRQRRSSTFPQPLKLPLTAGITFKRDVAIDKVLFTS